MGVAGCGKSSLAQAVALDQRMLLVEGDAFHSDSNVTKMRSGIALTDADREDWLTRLGQELQRHPSGIVLTCSALRLAYRECLRAASPGLRFAYLELDRHTAQARVEARAATHFFSASLMGSQYATLESPVGEVGVLRLDATAPLDQLRQRVAAWWRAGEEAVR
jgi:gluconokinase